MGIRRFLLIPLLFMCLVNLAAQAGQRNWTFQTTPGSGFFSSLSLQSGVWPIVSIYSAASESKICQSTPMGWSYLQTIRVDHLNASPYDEEVIGCSIERSVMLDANEFRCVESIADSAYDSRGRLWTITPGGAVRYRRSDGVWRTAAFMETDPTYGNPSIAFDPGGDLALLTGGVYQHYSPLTGWTEETILPNTPNQIYCKDLAFDAAGKPHTLCQLGRNFLLDGDPRTGEWIPTELGDLIPSEGMVYGRPQLATDENGTVATALSYGTSVYYLWNDGTGWQSEEVQGAAANPGLGFPRFCGIDFDHENLPVISYTQSDGKIGIAYDPIVAVPEPSVLTFLAMGLMLGKRRLRIVAE